MKYWLIAVSSPVRTSLRSSMISGLPCTRPPRSDGGRLGSDGRLLRGTHGEEQCLDRRVAAPAARASTASSGDVLDVERAGLDLLDDPAVVHGHALAHEHGPSMPGAFPYLSRGPNTLREPHQ